MLSWEYYNVIICNLNIIFIYIPVIKQINYQFPRKARLSLKLGSNTSPHEKEKC